MFDVLIEILAYAVAGLWLLNLALAVLIDAPTYEASCESEKVPAHRRSRLDPHDASW